MDEIAARVARHEADHAAMLRHFNWPVRGVTRSRGLEGETQMGVRLDGDPVQRAFELGCVLLAPSLHDTLGADRDLARLTELVATSDRLWMSEIYDATSRIVGTPEYIRRRQAVEHALYSRLSLSASEVERLLA